MLIAPLPRRYLFVCKLNICRSALAEGIMRHIAQQRGIDIVAASAALSGLRLDEPPDARAIVAARTRGIDISQVRSQLFRTQHFEDFDEILVLERAYLEPVNLMRPAGATTKVALLGSYLNAANPLEIDDPYYSGKFAPVISQIQTACDTCLSQLTTDAQ